MEQKDWKIAMECLVDVYTAKCEDELCGDGWIEFDGGEWPVEPGIPHQAKMKSGKVCDVRYNPKIWGMPQGDDPVTHYRLVKKEEKPKQDDGWIEWHGGECPAIPSQIVECKVSNGDTVKGVAREIRWSLDSRPLRVNVTAYRLAK